MSMTSSYDAESPDFPLTTSKMATRVETTANGLSIKMTAPDSDSDGEMAPPMLVSLVSHEVVSAPPPLFAVHGENEEVDNLVGSSDDFSKKPGAAVGTPHVESIVKKMLTKSLDVVEDSLSSSASCPKFPLKMSPVVHPEITTQGRNQVLEYSFNFNNEDSDLEGFDLDEEKYEEEEEDSKAQEYGVEPRAQSMADSADVLSYANDESNLAPPPSQGKKGDWVGIQKTTFTNWINDCLKPGKKERKVDDLATDLQDGRLLIKLLESLTKKKVKDFVDKDPKTEHHKRENLSLAFKFMREESIKMVGVGSTNVYEGNLKLILGMIWMLIQLYQIRIIGSNISSKDVMIKWVESLLPDWRFTDLTTEWHDGRALIAVLNEVKHGVAPRVASLDPTKRRKNCTTALNAAYNHLRVPKIFSADDLCKGKVDEMSMMMYLSYFVSLYRAKLLRWVSKVISHFGITGFTSDWYNGQAYAALIEACFPGSIRYWPGQDNEKFVETVIRFAQRNLGKTPPFTAHDLVAGKVGEIQIMCMVMMIKNGKLSTLAEEVRVSGPGLKEAQLHKETSFIVNTAGAGPGELNIDAYYEKDGEKLKFSAKEKDKTEVHLKYTPKRLMNIVFAITWSDTPILFSPFIVPVFDSSLVLVEDLETHQRVVNLNDPVELVVDASRAGNGRLRAHLVYGDKQSKQEVMLNPISKGRFKMEYTPVETGSATLKVWWNKTFLEHYQIEYTVIDRDDYCVVKPVRDDTFCTFDEVKFVVMSKTGLPLSVLQLTAIIDYELQLPLQVYHVDGKMGYVSFKPTTPGIYSIEVVCLDKFIEGSPFQVTVIDAHNLKVRQNIPSDARLGEPIELEIDAKDVKVDSLGFVSQDNNTPSVFKVKFSQSKGNIIKAELTPLSEGVFVAGIQYHGRWISGSPFNMKVCDPSKFSVLTDLRFANTGKPINFTIKAKEPNEEGVPLTVTAKGPNAQYSPRVSTSEDGLEYNVTFIPWEIGEHTINICYGKFHINGSPKMVPVIALDPTSCSATGRGLQRALTKVPAQFNVLGKGTKWVEDGTLEIKISSVMTKEECQVRVRDNNDGTYSVAYLIETPGAYLLEIKTAGQNIPGSPFRVNALPGPDSSKVKIYGPALEEGTVLTFGKPIGFMVDTKDGGNGKLSVKAVGPENSNARVFTATSDKDREYEIDIDPKRHGKHRVSVKWSGKHIPDSPFILKVFPGADASKCIAKGPGLEDGVMGKKTSFTIDTKNAGAGLLKVRLHGLKGAFKIQIKPENEKNRRVLSANYDPKFPGEYLIKIMWCDVHVPGSPFRVKIIGHGSSPSMPEIFIPTPRLPEIESASNFLEDVGEEDFDSTVPSSSDVSARLKSAPNVLGKQNATPSHREVRVGSIPTPSSVRSVRAGSVPQTNVVRSHKVRDVPATSARSTRNKNKKGEFEGQLKLQMRPRKQKK